MTFKRLNWEPKMRRNLKLTVSYGEPQNFPILEESWNNALIQRLYSTRKIVPL